MQIKTSKTSHLITQSLFTKLPVCYSCFFQLQRCSVSFGLEHHEGNLRIIESYATYILVYTSESLEHVEWEKTQSKFQFQLLIPIPSTYDYHNKHDVL